MAGLKQKQQALYYDRSTALTCASSSPPLPVPASASSFLNSSPQCSMCLTTTMTTTRTMGMRMGMKKMKGKDQ